MLKQKFDSLASATVAALMKCTGDISAMHVRNKVKSCVLII